MSLLTYTMPEMCPSVSEEMVMLAASLFWKPQRAELYTVW